MNTTNNPETGKKPELPPAPVIRVWVLAGELGLLIVIPLLVLLLVGIRLDKAVGTKPLFIIVSMILSFIISAIAIARKIRKVQNGIV